MNILKIYIFLFIFTDIEKKSDIYIMADLLHRDWLLFSTSKMIQAVDQSISINIIDTKNGGKRLIASGISEESIGKLNFIVNTDINNNYLYLEDFKVYVFGNYTPFSIFGLKEIMINVYHASDVQGFLKGEKTHSPFDVQNFRDTSFTGKTFSQYIDQLTGLLSYTPHTSNKVKTYQITLNPDHEAWWHEEYNLYPTSS
jgi:hypothetical protein